MNELNVAIIGCGSWGQNHARVYNDLDNAKLLAVCDNDIATSSRALPLIEIARYINDEMPEFSAHMAIEALGRIGKDIKGVKTTILGLAFRGGVSDARNSPSYELIDVLSQHGAEMVVHDPLIAKDQVLESKEVTLFTSLEEALSSASLIIIATNHGEYSELDLDRIAGLVSKPAVIIDGRNMIETTEVLEGLFLSGIGKRSLSPET